MAKAKRRKKRLLAFIGDECSGCGGSPVCLAMCPVEGAMEYVADDGAFPFGRVRVVPDRCIGCALCASKGYEGALTEGCPWNAVTMVPVEDPEQAEVGDPLG